jgi:hypothetical protein
LAEPRKFEILGVEFEIPQPFDAGHTCTDGEAKALNQLFKENLANNFRSTVKAAQDEAEKAGGSVDTAKLQQDFAEAASKYAFTIATVSASRKLDPVEREARNIVRASLRDYFASQNKKFSDLSDEDQEKLIESNASREDIVKLAKNIVAQRSKAANIQLSVDDGNPQQASEVEGAAA